jgi:hypothetical protein
MLILGGRYGSIEPNSGNSYIQVEYEYAISKNIPIFSVVLSESFLHRKAASDGNQVFENQNADKYKRFKEYVLTKIIREATDEKDIQLAVHTTLSQFLSELPLVGWIKEDAVDDQLKMIKQNEKLLIENLTLTKANQKLKGTVEKIKIDDYNGFTFEEVKSIMELKIMTVGKGKFDNPEKYEVSALILFSSLYEILCTGVTNSAMERDDSVHVFYHYAPYFMSFGLVENVKLAGKLYSKMQISKLGTRFYAKLQNVKGR